MGLLYIFATTMEMEIFDSLIEKENIFSILSEFCSCDNDKQNYHAFVQRWGSEVQEKNVAFDEKQMDSEVQWTFPMEVPTGKQITEGFLQCDDNEFQLNASEFQKMLRKVQEFDKCTCNNKSTKSCLVDLSASEEILVREIMTLFHCYDLPRVVKRNFLAGVIFALSTGQLHNDQDEHNSLLYSKRANETNEEKEKYTIDYLVNGEYNAKKNRKKKTLLGERLTVFYALARKKLCRPSFLFVTNSSTQLVKRILEAMKLSGGAEQKTIRLVPPIHVSKNSGQCKSGYSDKGKSVLGFLKVYCSHHAYPKAKDVQLLAKSKIETDALVYILPPGTIKKEIFNEYARQLNFDPTPLKYKHFLSVWNLKFPTLIIKRNEKDFCEFCDMLSQKLIIQGIDTTLINEMLAEHLRQAKIERNFYISQILKSRKSFLNRCMDYELRLPTLGEGSTENCVDLSIHISFDFSQPFVLPHFVQPHPSLFAKNGLKVEVFGVCCETMDKQVNYTLPEGRYPYEYASMGKGANVVVSLLHQYLSSYSYREKELYVQAGNCGGQGKNLFILYYFIWRVLVGKNDRIVVSYMIPGHSYFRPDMGFGLIQKRALQTDITCVEDLNQVIENSGQSNFAEKYSNVSFHDWKAFLSQFFKENALGSHEEMCSLIIEKKDRHVIVSSKFSSSDCCPSTYHQRYLNENVTYDDVKNSISSTSQLKPLNFFKLVYSPIPKERWEEEVVPIALEHLATEEEQLNFLMLNNAEELRNIVTLLNKNSTRIPNPIKRKFDLMLEE